MTNKWVGAWIALTVAFGLHVADEATHDFLSWYNPTVLALRERLGESFFPPTFEFIPWLTGLIVAVAFCAALTPLLHSSRRWLIVAAYVYGVIHTLNAVAHITVSVVGGWLAPGVLSSPLLLPSAIWLIVETSRIRTAITRSDAVSKAHGPQG